MKEFVVIRTWCVKATNTADAVDKAKPGEQYKTEGREMTLKDFSEMRSLN